MENVLKLYKYVDGVNDSPFPNNEEQVVISSFRYDVKRMSGAPSITCTVMHSLCLDKMWVDNIYTTFNGEKFFIKQTASSSYDNTDSRYKHEVELVSERIILDNVYFYDVVQNDVTNDKPVSNSSNVVFFGDIHEFANRLNYSLRYSKVGYRVVVDDGISSEGKMMSFQNQFFSNVLQEIYNNYGIPYYFVGKVIHIGYTNNAITHTFKYGVDESLLSIQKQNANYKVVNRVTGVGSADNIPYYYPNDYESKEEVEANGGTWINPQPNLMPSIYRETLGEERFYKALNNTYVSPQTGEYYYFENPFVEGKPKEHIVNFDEIKPSIKGMLNASNQRMDMFVDFAYDAEDNDETDEEGNYLHPYFFAKLRKFDGEYGFNLFDHAIDEQEMVISMTSGSCGACEWVIGVDEESQKNTVQVNSSGNLVRDDKGNIKFGTPQDRQNDTRNYEVWVALKKDINTFGVIMPNASSNYKPSVNDTFVILHIDLPKAYILAAENNLKEQLIKYMAMNNSEKFTFSISFSRIFFAENPQILAQLNENARIQIEYDNTNYELYVSSYSYSMSDNSPLPEIKVELSDTLTIQQNALQNAISEVKQDIMSSVGSVDWLKLGLKYFLRKDTDDKTQHNLGVGKNLTVDREVIVGENIHSKVFSSGVVGGQGWAIRLKEWVNSSGTKETKSIAEFDELVVRGLLRVSEFIISQLLGENDNRIYTGMMEVDHYDAGDGKVYLKTNGGKLYNTFRVDDIILVQQYGGMPSDDNNHYITKQYEFVVSEVGLGNIEDGEDRLDWIKFRNFSTPMEGGDESLIKEGDTLVRFDNLTDQTRKGIIQMMSVGEDAPYMDFIYGAKTDPENSLKARLGNISGVYNPLFGWLREFGAYISNLYAVGEFKIAHTGEDVSDALEIAKGLFRTNYKQSTYDVSEESNFFTNASFINNCEHWILKEDETTFFWSGDAPQFFNNEPYVSEDSFAGISEYDGRDMLRLMNATIKQENALIRKPSEHKEYSSLDEEYTKVGMDVIDTIYLGLRIYVVAGGTIEYGFVDENETFIQNSFHVLKSLEAREEAYIESVSGIWDSNGDFMIKCSGDMYIDVLSLIDKPLENLKITTSTSIEQDAKSIKLIGTKVNEVDGSITTVKQEVNAQSGTISSLVTTKVGKEEIISSINQSAEAVTINANKINLNGVVTFSMLNSDMQNTINAKANASSLGSLAYRNSVGKAMLDSTIISGGYINTSLIDVNTLVAKKVETNGDTFGVTTTMADGEIKMKTKTSVELLRIYSNGHSSYLHLKDDSSNEIVLTPSSSKIEFSNGKKLLFNAANGIELRGGMGIAYFTLSRISTSGFDSTCDFSILPNGGTWTLPSAKSNEGRMFWVYPKKSATLKDNESLIYKSDGETGNSLTISGMSFLISDGSNWYQGSCK